VRVLAFRHVPFEGLGRIEAALDSRGIYFEYCDLYLPGGVMPDAAAYDGLIFMGGPMSVNDGLPYLIQEMRVAEWAAAKGTPMLGICLGSQLIAKALGARVFRNAEEEIGWFDIHLTETGQRDPVFTALAPSQCVFHWHSETFDLPSGAELLAYSHRTAHQGYRIGPSIYGLQFHLEITPAMIVDWSREARNWGQISESSAPLDAWLNQDRCQRAAQALFGEWCDMLVRSHNPEDPLVKAPEQTGQTREAGPFPRCPSCGWQDVRVSRTRNALDAVLALVSVQRFKCRTCGSYFRRWRRPAE
jgi:GMP synthase (glutamine-hydrolysing)